MITPHRPTIPNSPIRPRVPALAFVAMSIVIAQPGLAKAPTSATVVMDLEQDHPFVMLTLTRRNGSKRAARFVIDTGGGAVVLTRALARDLGLSLDGEVLEEGEGRMVKIAPPAIQLGTMPLAPSGLQAFAMDTPSILTGLRCDGLLPARALAHYHVIFDYPGRRFTLAVPGSVTPRGRRMPLAIHPDTAFPRIELAAGGESWGFLLDTGASFSMLDRPLMDRLAAAHPDWPATLGAYGKANMSGGTMEQACRMVRLPGVAWGPVPLGNLAWVSRPAGTYMAGGWMSRSMTAPIAGALGGNALRGFRLELDYAHQAAYLEAKAAPPTHDLDLVGLTLRPLAGDRFMVAGVAVANAPEVIAGVKAGDTLLAVDDLALAGVSLEAAVNALRGHPNELRVLELERDGKPLKVVAPVVRLL